MENFFKIRAVLYRLISKPFCKESTPDYLAELREYLPVFRDIAGIADNLDMIHTIDKLEKLTYCVDDALIDSHEKLFARLFLSTGFASNVRSVVPVESVYLSGKGLIMQENRDQVLEFFYSQGLAKHHSFTEPEDHISAELYFLAEMSDRVAVLLLDSQDVSENIGVQIRFLEEHVSKWVGHVCADVKTIAENVPYGEYFVAIAELAEHYTTLDLAMLNTFIEEKMLSEA